MMIDSFEKDDKVMKIEFREEELIGFQRIRIWMPIIILGIVSGSWSENQLSVSIGPYFFTEDTYRPFGISNEGWCRYTKELLDEWLRRVGSLRTQISSVYMRTYTLIEEIQATSSLIKL